MVAWSTKDSIKRPVCRLPVLMDSVTTAGWFGNRQCFANPSKGVEFHKPGQQRFDNAVVLRCDRVKG